MPKALLALLVVAVLAGLTTPAAAMLAAPTYVPADELVASLQPHVEKNPEDAEAHLRLGLAHAHAFFNNNGFVATYPQQDRAGNPRPPTIPERWLQQMALNSIGPPDGAEPLSGAERAAHLRAGVASLVTALSLDDSLAHAHVVLGELLEAGQDFAGRLPLALDAAAATQPAGAYDPEAKLDLRVRTAAAEHFLAGYQSAIESDLARQAPPVGGLPALMSERGGRGFLRLWEFAKAAGAEPGVRRDVTRDLEKLSEMMSRPGMQADF